MSYEVFQERVNALLHPLKMSAVFKHDNGKHYANCSDGTVIEGNTVAMKVCVRWGSGHRAIAAI